ncbi:MAG: hypothetical protein MJA83_07695 [Gammaproteobacteria bacterium]|nr:hypothetical protein [Gammaproteobacteria bacterium]
MSKQPARGVRVSESESTGGALQQFSTPRWAVDRFRERFPIPTRAEILEPFAGQGAIIRAIHARRRRSSVPTAITAWEIDPEFGRPLLDPDLHALVSIGDMFDLAKEHEGILWPFDVVITNPPFKVAARALPVLQRLAPVVVMLLRVGWLGSAKRALMLAGNMPEQALMLPDRISFDGEGSPSDYHAWMVWRTRRCARTDLELLDLTPLEERKAPVMWWVEGAPPRRAT